MFREAALSDLAVTLRPGLAHFDIRFDSGLDGRTSLRLRGSCGLKRGVLPDTPLERERDRRSVAYGRRRAPGVVC